MRTITQTFQAFPSSRSGSGRQRPRQSLRLMAWPLQSLRSPLIPTAHPAYFFSLPMGDRGQGKEMSFVQKTRPNVSFVNIVYVQKDGVIKNALGAGTTGVMGDHPM